MQPGFDLVVGIEPADRKASDRPRVRVEDVGQCVQALLLAATKLVVGDEVQGGAALEGAPPSREDSGPHAIFDRDVGYDGYHHLVEEAIDDVHVRWRLLRFWLDQPPLVGWIVLHLAVGGDPWRRCL